MRRSIRNWIFLFYGAALLALAAALAGLTSASAIHARDVGANPALERIPVEAVDETTLRRAEDTALTLIVSAFGIGVLGVWLFRRPSLVLRAAMLAWLGVQSLLAVRGLGPGLVSTPRAIGILILFLGAQLAMGIAILSLPHRS